MLILEMAQSVLDELEFLDISAGIKKLSDNEDDLFDYVYHLPHANQDRIILRDPFKAPPSKTNLQLVKTLERKSGSLNHSIHEVRNLLNPSFGAALETSSLNRNGSGRSKPMPSRLKNTQGINDFLKRTVASDSPEAEFKFTVEEHVDGGNKPIKLVEVEQKTFHALPDFMSKRVDPNYVAGTGLVMMVAMLVQVVISTVS
jgi:hypothetical protein